MCRGELVIGCDVRPKRSGTSRTHLRLCDDSRRGIACALMFELYKLLAYDELSGNVNIRDSPLYYFQTLGYESAKEKFSRFNGCIISDSVGLGKSFIGGELLHDYRQRGDHCLLVVPANLTEQWEDLLQDDTDKDGNPNFGLEIDGPHLDVRSTTGAITFGSPICSRSIRFPN